MIKQTLGLMLMFTIMPFVYIFNLFDKAQYNPNYINRKEVQHEREYNSS